MTSDKLIHLRYAKPSMRMRLGNYILGKQKSAFKDTTALRNDVPSRKAPLDAPMPEKFNQQFNVEHWSAAGQDVITLHPKAGKGEWHIIYFHGGGFYLPMFKEHWPLVAALVEATGASVSVPLYSVIPEADYRPAYQQADEVYEEVKTEWGDEKIALCGDSAGGNLAIWLALHRRDAGKSLPARLIPFAPWLDMGMKDEAARAVEPLDNLLAIDSLRVLGEWWAADRPVDDPYASPLYADLTGLPPMAIFQGRYDVFVVDSRSFAVRAREAGVATALYEYEGGPHVYMALTFTPEAKDTLRLVKSFLDSE